MGVDVQRKNGQPIIICHLLLLIAWHARMDKLICKTGSQILCFAEKDKNRQCRMNNCIQISRNKRLFLDLRIMTVLNRASDKLIATGYSNCSDHTNFDTARLKLTVSWK